MSWMLSIAVSQEVKDALASCFLDESTRDAAHVTLLYLGDELTDEDATLIGKAAMKVAAAIPPFTLTLGGVASFACGEHGYPIVATVDSTGITALRSALEHALPNASAHGFVPHMTLGYVQSQSEVANAMAIAIPAIEAAALEWQADAIDMVMDDETVDSFPLGSAVQQQQQASPVQDLRKLLQPIGLDAQAIMLVRGLSASVTYLHVRSKLLQPVAKDILRYVRKMLPEIQQLKLLTAAEAAKKGQGFIEAVTAYRLRLVGAPESEEPAITTWSTIADATPQAAQQPKPDDTPAILKTLGQRRKLAVLKLGTDPKPETEERIVTGVVLEPEVVDGSADREQGTVGDIYSEEEIREAMYWWMEYADHTFAYHHVMQGGEVLDKTGAILLECWITRTAQQMGDQQIRKGTWMVSARVKSDQLWKDIKAGKIQSWSVGMSALTEPELTTAPLA